MGNYRPRTIDRQLSQELMAFGAVVLTGPKWCGKTTTAENVAKSALYMQDRDNRDKYLQLAETQPSLLLVGENPRLIDEWQIAPQLWDAVRFSIDRRKERGLYILTGSTVANEAKKDHSGIGRISKLRMRTMSLFESGNSTGEVSLGSLFSADNVSGISDMTLGDIARQIVRGGWPDSVDEDDATAYRHVRGYCESLLESEINIPGGRLRDRERMRRIMKSLSRNISTSVTNVKILNDISCHASADESMHINTLNEYIRTLEDIFVVENLPAWSPKLRSRTATVASETRHFADPAIAAYFLGSSAEDLLYDPGTFGLLFESMVIRDLRVYAQSLDGDVYHYRDRNGLEADAVVHLHNGKWGAIEIKLNPAREDEAAANLLKLKDKVDSDSMNPPSFLAVITATGYAYTRKDGVRVIPIGCLKD